MRKIAGLMATVAMVIQIPAANAASSLIVSAYGGSWGDGLKACIFDPFSASSGIAIELEPSASTVTLSKLQAQASSPKIDVAWMDGGVSELARDAGVVASIDRSKVPGIENVLDEATYETSGGDLYAIGTGYFAVGLVYNTDEVKTPPASWEDLWKPEYAGRVILPSAVNSIGVPVFTAFNKLAGGTASDLEPGKAKMSSLDVALFFDSSGVANSAFQTGEGIIGAYYATQAFTMAGSGLPIAYAIPKEGAIGSDIRVHLVKGTQKETEALQLIDFSIQPEQAKCLAEKLQIGPAVKNVTLPADVAARMPWGADGSIKNLAIADWDGINANRQALTETLTRIATGN